MRLLVVIALLAWSAACGRRVTDADPRLKEFSKLKHQQTEELAAKLHIDILPEVQKFYSLAEAGDWNAVSNLYAQIKQLTGQTNSVLCLPADNVLSVPLHETLGAYNEFTKWDRVLLSEYAAVILHSIPVGSVYFGGTDPGRFVITAYRDAAQAPDIFIISPKFVVPQNGEVISGYLEYLRLLYGGRLWVPAQTDGQAAFRQFIQDFQSRRACGEPVDPDENVEIVGGRVQVRGAKAAMNINAILTKWIFDRNKDTHEFYVEESYVIPWMYPHLEPYGLILKVNKEPQTQLDPSSIERDRQFWDKLTSELLADSRFVGSPAARKAYSKLRSAIGGVYQYRKLSDAAESAYRQAIQLCPDSPEANFRASQLLLEDSKHDAAIAVLQAYQKLEPVNEKIGLAIEQIRKLKAQAGSTK